ncbi:class Ib ribonucleoside-diphosphate reductase assembly flavoprotein NrdI [Bacillus inaquosorum]|uniref:class Ib ribonucleoside-diphosphate reductase assembly flavoprotein NrdI n=1 Tax=Bacillus inaquosorum TaxID=483913 RepID=UPI002281EB34|nr:class Ib ribonucleoside-diphosphate reductase assembly flavoprotein NrdI [Bacillus inaquosorum]MCY7911141.1 class Ib ribonucleoside-diphosphate reductase assembly flavoprotein NrdI [Bacillus inaquosorum]
MKVAFASMTGNVKRFINYLENFEKVQVKKGVVIDGPFFLITYTTGIGQVPKEVEEFLKQNSHNLIAVVGSGNRNWGKSFCAAAKKIAQEFNVPLIHEFEMSGTLNDAMIIATKITELQRG